MSVDWRRVVSVLGVCAVALVRGGAGRGDPMPSGTPDAVLGKVVSNFAGTRVQVTCGGDGNSLFLGLTIDGSMWLNEPLVCAPARRFADGWRPRQDSGHGGAGSLAHAVLTLTHESIHASGDTSEAHTECVAIQRVPEMVEELGERRPLYIAAVERKALLWHRRLQGTVSLSGQPYTDPKRCRKDGAWDLTPGDGVWP
jgi:hypothetical protein